jgi:hypothetical protein
VRQPRSPLVRVQARAVVAAAGRGILTMRIPEGEINAGQLELPGPGLLQSVDVADLSAALWRRCRARIDVGEPIATVSHTITRHRITLTVHAGVARASGRLEACSPHDPELPWTTATRKALARLGQPLPTRG